MRHRLISIAFLIALALSYVATASAAGVPTPTRKWEPAEKCAWLSATVPQTSAELKALAVEIVNSQNTDAPAIDATQVRPTKYGECDNGGFDGFILLGPQDGFDGVMRTLMVAPNGAIAGYMSPEDDATACGDPGPEWTVKPFLYAGGSPNPCDDTWVGMSGSFTGLSMTFYFWNDWDAPVVELNNDGEAVGAEPFDVNYFGKDSSSEESSSDSSSTDAQASTADCGQSSAEIMSSEDMATDMGWKFETNDQGEPIKGNPNYDGVFVTIDKADTLPDCWEADASYLDADGVSVTYHIGATDMGKGDRDLKVGAPDASGNTFGYATIYPPCADRETLRGTGLYPMAC